MRIYHYPITYQATICIEDIASNTRFALGNKGQRPFMCFGINPSTANLTTSDPTMNWLISYSESNHFDSCIMMNPYPLRTSKPKSLPDSGDCLMIERNYQHIEDIFKQNQGQPALAMWGDIVNRKEYIRKSVSLIIEISMNYGIHWKQLGQLTKSGNPRHINSVYQNRNTILLNDMDILKYHNRNT